MFDFKHLSAEQVERFYIQALEQVEARALLLYLDEIILPHNAKTSEHFDNRAHVATVLPKLRADFAATLQKETRKEEEETCPNGTGT